MTKEKILKMKERGAEIALKILQNERLSYMLDYYAAECPDCHCNPYISDHAKCCEWSEFEKLDDELKDENITGSR